MLPPTSTYCRLDAADIRRGSILSPEPFLTLTFHQFGSNDNREVAQGQKVAGQRIHTYEDENGKNSFWRFMIQVPVQAFETSVRYRLNTGAEIRFVVPAAGQNFNWVAHSCNGEWPCTDIGR